MLPAKLSELTLELGCYAGALTRRLAPRLGEAGRIVALEPNPAMAWVASQDLGGCSQRERIVIRHAPFEEAFELGPRSCDHIVANLTFGDRIVDWSATAKQLRPMMRPGGRFVATLLVRDSWHEAEDLLRETFRQMDLRESSLGLQRLQQLRPSLSGMRARMEDTLGLQSHEYVLTSHRMEILFPSARHFLTSPLVAHGPLRLWRTLLRTLPLRTQQECLWRFRNVLDTYYAPRPIRCTVRAAVVAFEAVRTPGAPLSAGIAEEYWSRFPSLRDSGKLSDDDEDEFEIEINEEESPGEDESVATISSTDPTLADLELAAHPKTATNSALLTPLISDEEFLGGPMPDALQPPDSLSRDLPTEDELSEDRLGEFSLEFDD